MRAIVIWIFCCAYLNCTGWVLSALHQLNAGGYAVALGLGLALGLVGWKKSGGLRPNPWPKLRRRFRRGFPLAFLGLAFLAFLGGALYLPANYDALAYRTPRVLHWLAAGQWHWVDTDFQRLNTRTAGFEWLTAPMFLFAHTDRLEFLLNIVSFLLLPGRFFALLTQLGVRPRAAWYWMWLFPSGYGYVLQAGSICNDMFGALMAFTAFEFALRAAHRKNVTDFWVAIVAAALMTSAKAFNILLLLPWGLAALPSLKLLLRRPSVSFVVIVFAATASLLPTAVLNWQHCRDWTGLAAEGPTIGGGGKVYRFVGNAVNLPMDNLVPPVFPFASQWDHLVERVVPRWLTAGLEANMEGASAHFQPPEMQIEEASGVGVGLMLLLLALLAIKIRAGNFWPRRLLAIETLILLATWGSVGIFMVQVGSAGPARYLLPFYPLMAAPVLMGPAAVVFFKRRLWRGVAWAIFGSAAMLLILSPPRPLWPAKTVLQSLGAEDSHRRLVKRAWDVYSAFRVRVDGFRPIVAVLPPDAYPLGLLAYDEPETDLWRPFGTRRVVQISHLDSADDLRSRGLKYALVSEKTLIKWCHINPVDWLKQVQAEPVQHFELKLLAREDPHGWLLVRFR